MELKIPGCLSPSGVCTLRKFKKTLASQILDEAQWLSECSNERIFGLREIPSKLFQSIKSASEGDKIMKKVKTVGKEIYDGYVKPITSLFV